VIGAATLLALSPPKASAGRHLPIGCIRRGHNGQLPVEWFHRVESYQWVTDSACKAAGVIDLPGSITNRP
jgi:hypothetical protein